MKTLSCREAGFDCDRVVKGETENGAQIIVRITAHRFKPLDRVIGIIRAIF